MKRLVKFLVVLGLLVTVIVVTAHAPLVGLAAALVLGLILGGLWRHPWLVVGFLGTLVAGRAYKRSGDSTRSPGWHSPPPRS